ncbi:PLP-dependent aminotransferase family protein [Bacillus cereus]|uniref:MocR-like pyridoxine biosynthesis transcription factor PdxR n=1 Tax=Bacillus TaxID=1386 RepID=UPI0005553D78|nr:PLP-dependent aminotransferase family protein [Bacillus sp. UNC322MFChir4.1]
MFWIKIDKSSCVSITRQIYTQIRNEILSGKLKKCKKIPSTRELANELNVSRNVVLGAYDLLYSEGYIESRQGAGTFVATNILFEKTNVVNNKDIKMHDQLVKDETIINFKAGSPDLTLFPRCQWLKCYNDTIKNSSDLIFGYHDPEGLYELRKALVDYLYIHRGMCCKIDNIIITNGAAQGLSIVSQLLIHKNNYISLEDPSSPDIYNIFHSRGAKIESLEVDEWGILTSQLNEKKPPKLIYVTPSHQFPIGGTLPIQRRIELINYARKHDVYIVEDDYDSEFRYTSPVLSPLQELEPNYVIYLGTLSKTLSPALRMGYMILPDHLVEKCREIKWYIDLHSPSIEQKVLSNFIVDNHLDRQIRRSNKIYKEKNSFLVKSLKETFKDIKLYGFSTGLHLVVEFADLKFSEDLIKNFKNQEVILYPVKNYSRQSSRHDNKWILGFGHLTLPQIKCGVERINSAINSC